MLIKIVFLLITQKFLLKILLIEKGAYLCPISFYPVFSVPFLSDSLIVLLPVYK